MHIDIMDGKFVPNVSINLAELGDAHEFFNLEIHLMVKNPESYFEDCKEVGAKRVYFHLEGTKDIAKTLFAMERYEFQKGIALNPGTSVAQCAPFAKSVDAVLLMSVTPGAQGSKFIPSAIEKIPAIKAVNEKLLVGMDGGISKVNIQDIFLRGIDYIASGSAIWKAQNSIASLRELEEIAEQIKKPHGL